MIIKFKNIPINTVFTFEGTSYVRIWEISKACCGGGVKGFYNAVLEDNIAKGFTFDDEDDCEV